MTQRKATALLLTAVIVGSFAKDMPQALGLYEYDELDINDTLDTPLRLQSELLNLDGLTYTPDAVRIMMIGKGDVSAVAGMVHVSHLLHTQDGYVAFGVTTEDKLPLLRSHGLTVMPDIKLEFDQVRDASRFGEILGSAEVNKEGLKGLGVKVAVVDTGVDFANKDLSKALARDSARKPIMLDADGQGIVLTRTKFIAQMTPQGTLLNDTMPGKKFGQDFDDFTSTVYFNNDGVFLNVNKGKNGTKFEVYNSIYPLLSPLIINASAVKDWKIGESRTNFIRSASGEYHMGFALQIQFHVGKPGLIIVPVLVVDSKEPGVYDTIIADMSTAWADFAKFEIKKFDAQFDLDFTDEKRIKIGEGNEFLTFDEKKDGDIDLTAGTVGARVLDVWGAIQENKKSKIDNYVGAMNGTLLSPMDVNGTYFGLMFDYLGHGTGSASSIASRGSESYDVYGNSTKYRITGVAPDADIIPIKALWFGDVVYGWLWASGFEQDVSGNWNYTGKHRADIVNNSWGVSTFPALDYGTGFDLLSVLSSILSVPHALDEDFPGVLMVASSGNSGPGYGTVTTPASSPFALTVGATTSNVLVGTGFTRNEPRFGNSTAFFDDIAEFSSRGPSLNGDAKPEVMSVGAYGFVSQPPNVKHAPNATGSFGFFGGTSMSAPLASGAAALVMEGLKKEGIEANPFLVKAILMSTATDLYVDPFTQGSGKVDVEDAIAYVLGKSGRFLVYTNDTYQNFAGLLDAAVKEYSISGLNYTLSLPDAKLPSTKWYAGYIDMNNSKEATFIVANPANDTLSVEIEPTMLQMIGQQSINGTTEVRQKDFVMNYTKAGYIPNYVDLSKELQIPPDTETMTIMVHFPFESFLNTTSTFYGDSLRIASLYFYDWHDVNKDGKVWANETSLVNRGGVWGTVQHLTVRDPLGRIDGKPLLGVYPVPTILSYWAGNTGQNSTAMNYTMTANFYKKTQWDMLSVDTDNLNLTRHGQLTFNARITVPADVMPGIYQGFITVRSGVQTTNIPVSFAVPMAISSKDVPLVISGESRNDLLYDNAVTYGSFDMLARYNTGEWRFYQLNITDPTMNAMSMKVSWRNNWTSVNAMVTDPLGKIIASSVPAGVFKTFAGWASNDWLGSTRFSEGGGFYPAQNFGGNATVLYVPINSTGVHTLMLHTTLFHGKSLSEPLVIEMKPTTILPDTSPPNISLEFPEYGRGIIRVPVMIEEENIEDAAYSIDGSPPVSLKENSTMVVDTTILMEGLHNVAISASDTVGHKVFKDIIFVADNIEPHLNVRSPADGSVVADLFDVNLEVSDSSLKVFGITLPNGTRIDNTSSFSVDTSSLADGEYTMLLSAEDAAGNVVEEKRTIKVDRTKPVVEITNPGDGTTVSNTLNIKYMVDDANLQSITLTVGEKSIEIENTGSYDLDTKTLFDGEYTLKLTALDMAGNTNSKSVGITSLNLGPALLAAQLIGIAIGAAIGVGAALAVLLPKYRKRNAKAEGSKDL